MAKSQRPSLAFLTRHIWRYVRLHKRCWVLLFVFAIVVSAISLAQPLVFRAFIDDALLKKNTELLEIFILVYLGVAVSSGLLRMGSTLLRRHIELWTAARERDDLFFHLEHLDLDFFRKHKTGDLLERLEVDIQGIQDLIALTARLLLQVLGILFLVGISLSFDWKLTLAALVTIPFYIFIQRSFATRLWPLAQRARLSASDLLSFLEERLTGIFLIQILGREEAERERERELGLTLARSEMRQTVVSNLGALTVNLLSVAILLVVLWYGGYQVIHNQLSLGTLLALYTYLSGLFAPIETVASFWSDIQEPLASIQRVAEIQNRAPRSHDVRGALVPKNIMGEITFDDVSFGYEPRVPVIRGFDLTIRAGEHLGIVGPTGCGKTTLGYLLLRMYQPQSGRITLDGIDINHLKLRALRNLVTYLPQETLLFHTTIRENIALGSGRAVSLSKIRRITERLGLDIVIQKWPKGYDTVIGEKGAKLSSGQRQLVGLARLLLRNPRVVILDEATSSLDSVTEKRVHDALKDFLKDRTAIYIAHRLRTVAPLDRIIVLDQGQIVESGTFDRLKKHRGAFRKFYQAQRV